MRKVGVRDMYSLQYAAKILGKSETTIRRWMKLYGMRVVSVITDARRVYIADDDMKILIEHVARTVFEDIEKKKEKNRNNINRSELIISGGCRYYSLARVASSLGVSLGTVRRWSKEDEILLKRLTTNKNRIYIAHDDVLQMAELHGCKVSPKFYEGTEIQEEVKAVEPDMDMLCTVKEAALYLDVTEMTVRDWIREDNIEKRTKFTGRHLICITYRDVLRLAELHGREVVPIPSSLTVREEIEEIKSQLRKVISDIEDIKHDLRILAKRSIYVGGMRKKE